MKKIFAFVLLSVAIPASAATINLVPESVSVPAGEQFSFAISVDAGSEKAVTVKSALSYPEDLLEPVSFSFATNLIPLSQTGYDQMSGGMIIKTAGFPGGFTGTRDLGTITFKAKQTGSADVSIAASSLILNTQNVNVLSGVTVSVITIAEAEPIKAIESKEIPVEPKDEPITGAPQEGGTEGTETATTSGQEAAIAETGFPLRTALIVVLSAAILGGLAWRLWRK